MPLSAAKYRSFITKKSWSTLTSTAVGPIWKLEDNSCNWAEFSTDRYDFRHIEISESNSNIDKLTLISSIC